IGRKWPSFHLFSHFRSQELISKKEQPMEQAQLVDLATRLIQVISPLIAQRLLQDSGAQTVAASDPFKRVWEILQQGFAAYPKAQAALILFEDDPNDSAMQLRVAQQIITIFQNDLTTLIELRNLITQLQTQQLQTHQAPANNSLKAGIAGSVQAISGESQVGVAVSGDVYGNILYGSERSKSATKLLEEYLERQIARHSIISLQGFRDQMAADDVMNLRLDQIYTQIITVQSKQSITRAIATNKTLVVVGEPGGGKSTVLRFLTLHL